MLWHEAVKTNGVAVRFTLRGTTLEAMWRRYADGSADRVEGLSGSVRAARPEEVEGFTDWMPQ